MDYDLFDPDDDGLLSCVEIDPSQHETEKLPTSCEVLPEFHCSGEDSINSPFSEAGFVKNSFISSSGGGFEETINALSGCNVMTAQLHGQSTMLYLFGETCMQMQHLLASTVRSGVHAKTDSASVAGADGAQLSHYQCRRQVTEFLHFLLHSLHTDDTQYGAVRAQLSSMRALLNRITEAETWQLIYCANSSQGNDCTAPAYHLLHGALEWKLLDLCILHRCELPYAAKLSDGDRCLFTQQLERIFADLLACTVHHYAKKRPADLFGSSPFACTCLKELWLLLQLALHKWRLGADLTFWPVFNRASEQLKTRTGRYAMPPLDYCELTAWLVHALTRLQGYRSNGEYAGPQHPRAIADGADNVVLLESCTQQLLQNGASEEQLRAYIGQLAPTLLQWWRRPNLSLPLLLWEHFHKRLSATFYAPGATPAQLAVACANGHAYLAKYRALLQATELATTTSRLDPNLSSYTLFVLLLGGCLRRLLAAQRHQLIGRIYTKFSAAKLLALNETGLHHLLELFVVLLLCGDFDELAPRLRDHLLGIALPQLTPPRQLAVTKGHAALLILHAELRRDMSVYITRLLRQLLAVSNDVGVARLLADSLPAIFAQADDFARGEALLIDTWLPHYLGACTPDEHERTLAALQAVIAKLPVPPTVASTALWQALLAHVLPHVKQQYAVSYSAALPQLAADFCLRSCACGEAPAHWQGLFRYFSGAATASRECAAQFVLRLLDASADGGGCGERVADAKTIVAVWLRSLVLLGSQDGCVVRLSAHVVRLPLFALMTALDDNPDALLQAREPLVVFVAAVGRRYTDCAVDDYERRCQIADNFNTFLCNFDRWLPPDGRQEQRNELALRFYSFLAIVIYHCAPIVYTKAKINCFFHVALSRYVLTPAVQMGRPPEPPLAQLVHKIWPVLVQGVGRLSYRSDAYVSKTLSDLVQKWTPHFRISAHSKLVARPYVACLHADNADLALCVLERLTTLFLATQRRQADANACLVITIFRELIDSCAACDDNDGEQRLQILVKASGLLMLEHIMMVDELQPSRGQLLELFGRLLGSAVWRASALLPQLLAEHVRIIIKKHLAYHTFFCFDLLTQLARLSAALVAQTMDFLCAEVRIVEEKRGAGEDARMRACLQKLRETIAAA